MVQVLLAGSGEEAAAQVARVSLEEPVRLRAALLLRLGPVAVVEGVEVATELWQRAVVLLGEVHLGAHELAQPLVFAAARPVAPRHAAEAGSVLQVLVPGLAGVAEVLEGGGHRPQVVHVDAAYLVRAERGLTLQAGLGVLHLPALLLKSGDVLGHFEVLHGITGHLAQVPHACRHARRVAGCDLFRRQSVVNQKHEDNEMKSNNLKHFEVK